MCLVRLNQVVDMGSATDCQRKGKTMAANSKQQKTLVNLNSIQGTGETSRFVTDVTGVLIEIQMRGGTYEVVDRKTGEKIVRPNSCVSVWRTLSGTIVYMSWPTYFGDDGQVHLWSRFNGKRIKLQQAVEDETVLHFYRDRRNFYHLELVEEEHVTGINPMPIAVAAPAVAPWEVVAQ